MYKLPFHYRVLLSFFVSIAVTALSLFFVMDAQRARTINLNDIAAQRQTRLLQSMVERDINTIDATAVFFQVTEPIEWHHFPEFASDLLGKSEGLEAVQWMEKVEVREAAEHLSNVNKLYPQALLYTISDDKGLIEGYDPKGDAPLYIATDVYPRTPGNSKVIGFYPTKERFNKILKSIILTKRPALSDKVTLLQDDINNLSPSDGFLVYYPVFESTNEALKGVVIGVLRASTYFDYLISKSVHGNKVSVQIMDSGDRSGDDPILYQSDNWQQHYFYQYVDTVNFSNRTWNVVYRFQSEFDVSDVVALAFVAIAGVIASFFVAAMVNEDIIKQARLERALEKRTKELNYMVNHDSQTGALNRRAFNQAVQLQVENSAPFSLITFDIDKFKLINDNLGHPVGDAALKHIADIVQQKLHEGDKLYRIGGDEFNILSMIDDEIVLKSYMNTIRHAISTTALVRRESIFMSISMGGAVWRKGDVETLVHHVDAELYNSKEQGRDCVSVYQGSSFG